MEMEGSVVIEGLGKVFNYRGRVIQGRIPQQALCREVSTDDVGV